MTDEFLPIRLSHLLRHYSVGAIVRGPESLVVVQDIRSWFPPGQTAHDREIRYVDQVRSALGIPEALCRPPEKREQDGVLHGWIPASRFPTWMRCLKCGLLQRAPWRAATVGRDELHCGDGECEGRLEQVPWVLVHELGYLADAPWHHLAHADARRSDQRQCGEDRNAAYLELLDRPEGRIVRCRRCGATGRMELRLRFGTSTWQQPWFHEPPQESSEEPAWLLEINDVRVHSAENRTALVIPPESRIRRGTVVDRLYGNVTARESLRHPRSKLHRKSTVKTLATEYRCSSADIEAALADIERGYPLYGRAVTKDDLEIAEYKALSEPIPDLRETEDFVTTHHTRAWRELTRSLTRGFARVAADSVSSLVAVNRLKEILVLTGFRRAGGERVTTPDLTGECDWRPAIELYGEGVFFTLDETLLRRWEANSSLQARARAFEQRLVTAPVHLDVRISPRFLLCHTLAHLMIRQIEATAGYPAASLKERIYCADGEYPMSGILIYVAVPDEEGFPRWRHGACSAQTLPEVVGCGIRSRAMVLLGSRLLRTGRSRTRAVESRCMSRLRAVARDQLPVWKRASRPSFHHRRCGSTSLR